MLKQLLYKLTGREDDGFKPSKIDRELMENVQARLMLMGGFARPTGTVIRSIPGARVNFLSLAGSAVPTVFNDEDRPVGSFTEDGEIVYTRNRSAKA